MSQTNTKTTAPTTPASAKPKRNGSTLVAAAPARGERLPGEPTPSAKRVLALFCHEAPDSFIGRYVSQLATELAKRQNQVHLFCREAFELPASGITVQRLGASSEPGLIEQVEEFGQRAAAAFTARFPAKAGPVTLVGFEWSTVPALRQIQETRSADVILSLHSLERQRSDMASELSQNIHGLELLGLTRARSVLVHENATAEAARACLPECSERLVHAREAFPAYHFATPLDAGSIKARIQVGPIDPMIMFIGDLDHRHAPDVLMRSVPAVLKNHKQARFVFVGCGDLYWPLRVHARYLLLEHAIRLVGSVMDRPLYDLVQAADLVVVPSREATMWWPIQAAWAAAKPVVVSQPLMEAMRLRHEIDCIGIYSHESSCVWGIERVLFDGELAAKLGQTGRETLQQRFGSSDVAEQIEQLAGVRA